MGHDHKFRYISVLTLFLYAGADLQLQLLSGDGRATNPAATQEAIQSIVENFNNKGEESVKAKL